MAQYQASSNPYSKKFGPQTPFSQQYDYAWEQQKLGQQTAEDDFARYRKQLQEQALEQASQKAGSEIRKRYQSYIPKEITSVEKAGPKELQDILARQKAGLEGYSAPQLAAMQAQMAQGQQAAQVARDRALQAALAKQNIRGGAAASLQAQLGMQAGRERAAQDTEMMLKQAAKQEEALKAYREGVLGSLDVAQRKQFTDLATKLAGEQAAAAEAASRRQQAGIESYGESMAKANKGGCLGIFLLASASLNSITAEAKINDLRSYRDTHMSETQQRGYYKTSELLIPILDGSKILQGIVHTVFLKPMTQYGESFKEGKKPSFISKVLTKTYLKAFELVAGSKKFQRSNGEWV